MKKIIAFSLVAASLVATSSFGQGYFQLTSGKSQAYDGFTTPGVAALGATVDVSFMWAAAATTPTIDTLISAQSIKLGTNGQTGLNYTAATAWGAILNNQFTLATNSGTGNMVAALTSATGVINYNGGSGFGVTGTTAGTTYTIYEIAWSSAYADPFAAAAANAAVGWSAPIQYTAVSSIGTPQTTLGAFPSFGTFAPAAAPEPSTMALAALGGASLLLFRRRK